MNSVVSKCIELLPPDKVRFMLGAYNPVTMLELIDIGIDVFDGSYTYLATVNSCALTFNFNVEQSSQIDVSFDIDLSADRYNKIRLNYFIVFFLINNFFCFSYKEDFTPILLNCNCLACKKYTKAYIYHLVNTKELLASILLMMYVFIS